MLAICRLSQRCWTHCINMQNFSMSVETTLVLLSICTSTVCLWVPSFCFYSICFCIVCCLLINSYTSKAEPPKGDLWTLLKLFHCLQFSCLPTTIMDRSLGTLLHFWEFSNSQRLNPSPHPTNNVGRVYPEFFSEFWLCIGWGEGELQENLIL